VGLYRCGDGRWIHLHGGFPRQWPRTLDLLNAQNTKDAVANAAAKWNALALEESLAFMNLCGAVVRTREEWAQTAQGAALADTPPIVLKKIGEAPPLRLSESRAPLDGIRILDLTRVLAGPTCARTLASYGAEVLNLRAERLEQQREGPVELVAEAAAAAAHDLVDQVGLVQRDWFGQVNAQVLERHGQLVRPVQHVQGDRVGGQRARHREAAQVGTPHRLIHRPLRRKPSALTKAGSLLILVIYG